MTPTPAHVETTARRIRARMGHKSFLVVARGELTDALREASGQPSTRLKVQLATQLTDALLRHGIRVHPELKDVDQYGYVRLYRASSIPAELLDLIERPHPGQDQQLADIIKKIKGEWRWDSTPEDPAA